MEQDRITIVEKFYFEAAQGEQLMLTTAYERLSHSLEQPYQRKCKATEAWQKIDSGWLGDNVSMIIIENVEGKGPIQKLLSQEEKNAIQGRILYVSLSDVETPSVAQDGFIVSPGDSLRISPTNVSKVIVRCPSGIVKFNLTAFAR